MNPLRVGLAGLGTVGVGVFRRLSDAREVLLARAGREIAVTAVSARDRGRDRGIDLGPARWCEDARDLVAAGDIDVVVELIGGEDGIARALCQAALDAGKPVVTANKALIALHGSDLAARADAAGVALNFEAAVAGGIPIVKALREGLAANRIDAITGILNGTCNYILSEMRATGRDFAEVLAEAQDLGYAEADPAFDVDGIDAAHKLAILASLAFGQHLDFANVHVEGIRQVSAVDIAFAEELGYRIKLLGIARRTDHGIEQRVHPCMVPVAAPIARVDGVFNAVVAEGDYVGRTVFEGRGAGETPTASAVVADLIDIARGLRLPSLGVPVATLAPARTASMDRHVGPYYARLTVIDRPGVMADVTAILRDESVSIESMLQRGRAPNEAVPVVMIFHETQEDAMRRALRRINALDAVREPPTMIRIEQL